MWDRGVVRGVEGGDFDTEMERAEMGLMMGTEGAEGAEGAGEGDGDGDGDDEFFDCAV